MDDGPTVLTYLPLSYDGRGPAESCVNILKNIPVGVMNSLLVLPRAKTRAPEPIHLQQTLPSALRDLPWALVAPIARRTLNEAFGRALDAADEASTAAYFWPDPPTSLITRAKDRGILAVREMINCYRGTAKRVMDEAYRREGLEPNHGITDASVDHERSQLLLYDYVFASRQVEPTLIEAGVDPARILPTAFGWSPDRFAGGGGAGRQGGFTAIFAGTVSIRKGVPQLLRAWKRSGVAGRLLIVGSVEDEMKPLIKPYLDDPTIEFVGFSTAMGRLYRQSDVFVFPTFEEGGPQVVYEAAGCGLPVITTPMGSGRLVEHEVNGLVVGAGEVEALAAAIARMAASAETRRAYGARARADAAAFTYERLGAERATMLVAALARHGPSPAPARP